MATKVKLGIDAQWGVKENGVLGFNDENGVFKAIELASSRASGATYVAESGLIADAESGVPRIDWTNGVGELLLEPQSTNLVTYSELFGSGYYFTNNALTITNNNAVSPDGSSSACEITDLSSGGYSGTAGLTLTDNTDYTFSYYIKNIDASSVDYRVIFSGGSGGSGDGSFSVVSSISTSEWTRITHTFNSGVGRTIFIRIATNINAGGSVLIWGAQLEELSYPTSYIRTEGSAVTRIEDNVSKTGLLDTYLPSLEGSFFVDFTRKGDDPVGTRGGVVYHRFSNLRGMALSWISDELFFGSRNNTSSVTESIKNPFLINERAKVCVTYTDNGGGLGSASGNFNVYVNGVKVVTNSTYYAPDANYTDLRLSYGANSGDDTEVSANAIREFKQYDNVLSDAEAIALTTI
jgi:hypothetical protein